MHSRSERAARPAAIRVLIVEDNPADADLLRIALEDSGERFEIQHVTRLGDALSALRTTTYDVVLLDLGLPDAVGMDGLKRLRPEAPRSAVVVLTGLKDSQSGVRALEAGAQDYLVKGWQEPEKVVARIRTAIERRGLMGDLAATSERMSRIARKPGT